MLEPHLLALADEIEARRNLIAKSRMPEPPTFAANLDTLHGLAIAQRRRMMKSFAGRLEAGKAASAEQTRQQARRLVTEYRAARDDLQRQIGRAPASEINRRELALNRIGGRLAKAGLI